MAKIHDVAAYIVEKQGPMTAMKLQKLIYYCQAWSLVWDEEPIFPDRIEAWVSGPVAPALYRVHRGQFEVRSWSQGDLRRLSDDETETIDAVLDFYGRYSSHQLSALTHSENPWRAARHGLDPTERGNREITKAAMAEYYDSLLASGGEE